MTIEPTSSRVPDAPERRQKVAVGAVFLLALLLCVWVNGRWLTLRDVPGSGAEDLAKHVAMALNFRAALAEGQFLPRLQPHGELIGEMPLFQYYGFFEGLVAWPFLMLGLKGLQAVTAAIVLLRWGAFIVVYLTGRVLRASPPAAALCGFAYVLSPYLINNELTRVAVAEVHAHNLLPLCTFGWALLLRGKRPLGTVLIALGMMTLAMAHAIFFLYTAVLLVVLSLFSLPDWRTSAGVALGSVGGVLLAGVQWYPAFASQADLAVDFLSPIVTYRTVHFVSLSGLWGWLRPYEVPMKNGLASYYFTFAWWTIPSLAGLVWAAIFRRERRLVSIVLLAAGAVFFMLIVPPLNVWAVLPATFAAVQFSYRLIAYVALIAALGLAVTLPKLPWTALCGLLPVMILSQWPAIHADTQNFGKISLTDPEIAAAFSSYDYTGLSAPKSPLSDLTNSDGMLKESNHLRLRFGPKPGVKPVLQLTGYNESTGPMTLRLVPTDSAGEKVPAPLQSLVLVPAGAFSVTLPLDANRPDQRIVCAPPSEVAAPAGMADSPSRLPRLRSVLQSEEADALLLPAECLEETGRHGYQRELKILPGKVQDFALPGKLRSGDGWLREDNLIDLPARAVRLRGANVLTQPVRLYGASPEAPDVPKTEVVEIPPGAFDVTLSLVGVPLPTRLFFSPALIAHEVNPASPDRRRLGLLLSEGGATLSDGGYASYVVQTPIAYNRFWEVTHDGKSVRTFSDSLYHLCVLLPRPGGTLTLRYRMPWTCWILSGAGLLLCGCQPWLWRKLAPAQAGLRA